MANHLALSSLVSSHHATSTKPLALALYRLVQRFLASRGGTDGPPRPCHPNTTSLKHAWRLGPHTGPSGCTCRVYCTCAWPAKTSKSSPFNQVDLIVVDNNGHASRHLLRSSDLANSFLELWLRARSTRRRRRFTWRSSRPTLSFKPVVNA